MSHMEIKLFSGALDCCIFVPDTSFSGDNIKVLWEPSDAATGGKEGPYMRIICVLSFPTYLLWYQLKSEPGSTALGPIAYSLSS